MLPDLNHKRRDVKIASFIKGFIMPYLVRFKKPSFGVMRDGKGFTSKVKKVSSEFTLFDNKPLNCDPSVVEIIKVKDEKEAKTVIEDHILNQDLAELETKENKEAARIKIKKMGAIKEEKPTPTEVKAQKKKYTPKKSIKAKE